MKQGKTCFKQHIKATVAYIPYTHRACVYVTEKDSETVRSQTRWLNVSECHTNTTANSLTQPVDMTM